MKGVGEDLRWHMLALCRPGSSYHLDKGLYFFHCQQGCWKYPCYLFSLSIGFSIRNKATFIPSLLGLPPAICSYSLHHRHYSFPWAAKSEFSSFFGDIFYLPKWVLKKERKRDHILHLSDSQDMLSCFMACEAVKKDFTELSGVKMYYTAICTLCRRYSVA